MPFTNQMPSGTTFSGFTTSDVGQQFHGIGPAVDASVVAFYPTVDEDRILYPTEDPSQYLILSNTPSLPR